MLTLEEELICTQKASLGDEHAINELVSKNLRFVISVAKQYASTTNMLEDLVNEGNIGLITAAKKFRPSMDVKFISYAVWWIQKYINDYIYKHRMIRLPANKINDLSKLNKQINQLEQKFGRSVDIVELINEFGYEDENGKNDNSSFELLDMLNSYNVSSLDRTVDEDDHTILSDLMSDETIFKSADHLVVDNSMKIEVARLINSLKPRDKRVLIGLFGLDGNTPMTLIEMGDEIGVSREMVRQIKQRVLLKFKTNLNSSTLRDY